MFLSNLIYTSLTIYIMVYFIVWFAVILNVTKFFLRNRFIINHFKLYFLFTFVFSVLNIPFCFPTFFHIFSKKKNFAIYMNNYYETVYEYVYQSELEGEDED